MAISGFDPTDPRVQLELVTRDLRHEEEKVRQLEAALAQAYANLGRKEAEVNQLRVEREDLKLKWELSKRDLRHLQEKFVKGRNTAKVQVIVASAFFFLLSAFIGLGTNLLTAMPPNELGWIIITVAILFYITGTLFTTRLAFEGGN
jgi:hypothetical protein